MSGPPTRIQQCQSKIPRDQNKCWKRTGHNQITREKLDEEITDLKRNERSTERCQWGNSKELLKTTHDNIDKERERGEKNWFPQENPTTSPPQKRRKAGTREAEVRGEVVEEGEEVEENIGDPPT